MKRTKRWLAGLLCAVLLAGLLPTTALAADASWASTAVTALNNVYGRGIFSADDAEMTQSDLKTILQRMGSTTSVTLAEDSTALTRGTACAVLVDIFQLPANGSAIEYLYSKNIINGRGPDQLDGEKPITKAEFAVITYRVLNSVGGGKGSSTALKPGTKEYFALMYLAFRGCALPLSTDSTTLNQRIGEVTITQNPDTTLAGQDLWNSWAARLNYLKNKSDDTNTTINGATYEANDTLIAAAIKMVDAYIANGGSSTIFSDVAPGSWYYDGVMYLADHGIVSGFGDGRFGPEVVSGDNGTVLTRTTLALILFKADRQTPPEGGYSALLNAAKTYAATTKNYMTPSPDDENWWSGTPTREETIVAIMKQQKVSTNSVNTAILDRFTGTEEITEGNKPYIAYAVSLGIVNGTANGGLGLSEDTTRGMAGVLLYRTLLGEDKTKMKDYEDNVSYATGAASAQTFALFAAPAAQADTQLTLTLQEDWRLTSDLDLAVPEGATLTISGNGHHIYEMGGKLTNSGKGTVEFTNGTTLYPAANDDDAKKVTDGGTWDAGKSTELMRIRQGGGQGTGTETGLVDITYTNFNDQTAHLASGYFTIQNYQNGTKIQSGHTYLVQLVHNNVASIFVVDAQSDNTLKFLCNCVVNDSLGVWDLGTSSSFDAIENANVTSLKNNCILFQPLGPGVFRQEGRQ